MKLTLGFSTCPNDTFIFDAMVNGKIDTEGLEFDCILADVEELNRRAFGSVSDITKISYHAYAHIAGQYLLLNSGSALGHNNGPLLVGRKVVSLDMAENYRIAIPGKYTTARLLLGYALPGAVNTIEYLFSDIEDAVISGEVDAGLIIHENRFTFEKRGLMKIADMGEYWEKQTGMPIPLGGIAVKRDLPQEVAIAVDRVLSRSIEFAFNNPSSSMEYVRKYAVSMEQEVMESHINLYVNEYTRNLGEKGKAAVEKLYSEAVNKGIIPELPSRIFVI
jgi:1,4-dihydroxy-6-naphthoate synthase